MIDSFTIEQFMETVQAWTDQPLRQEINRGEFVVILPLDRQAEVRIRTSISPQGMSAGVGDNSIRLVLTDTKDKLLATLEDTAYVTRLPGWETRLLKKVEMLKQVRAAAGDCKKCRKPLHVFTSHTAKNPNRQFVKCEPCGYFSWLDAYQNPLIAEPFGSSRQAEDTFQTRFRIEETERAEATEIVEVSQSSGVSVDEIQKLLAKVSEIIEIESTKKDDLLSMFDSLDPEDEQDDSIVPFQAIEPVSFAPNPEQLEVIEAPLIGAFRVNAGPGSGKTAVLAWRYNFMVQHGISPNAIVAVTYGSKAAGNLLKRILKVNPSLAGSAVESQVTTIHAFCLRVGKAYGLVPRDISVAEGKDGEGKSQFWRVRAIVEEAINEVYPKGAEKPTWKETYEWIQTCKHHGVRPGNPTRTFLAEIMDHNHADRLTRIRDILTGRMQAANLITFSDMVYLVDIALQDNPVFLAAMKHRFSHVLLDEGQDTPNQAMRILSTISDNFMIVGDIDQLLYRFAGATPEANLLDGFEERFPDGQMYLLNNNHRSAQQVVQAAKMIRNNYDDFGGPYEVRYLKALKAVKDAIGNIHHIETLDPLDDSRHAADLIMQIAAEQNQDVKDVAGDFFLAVRVRAYSVYLEDALARAGIPFVNATGMSFWNLPHVQKFIAWLRLAANYEDADAFAQVYQIPSKDWRISWKGNPLDGQYKSTHMLRRDFLTDYPTYQKLESAYSYDRLNWKYKAAAEDICETMYGFAQALQHNLQEGLRYLKTEIFQKYLTWEDGQAAVTDGEGGKLDDLDAVIEISHQFEQPEKFLKYIEEIIAAAQSAAVGEWDGRAVIATIHKLKGLERKTMILCGCSEYDKVKAKGVTSLLPHTFTFAEPQSAGVLPAGGGCRLEDERCLFYVAVTRAMENVFILSPKFYREQPMEPSRFVYEMIDALEGR